MPLPLRNVKPLHLSRDTREMKDISKNLEHFKNYTLVNIIRQLSNLSRHAEDIFMSIHQEAAGIFQRTSNLRIKVQKLSSVIETLDPLKDDDDLEGALQKLPFYSKNTCENNLMDRSKLPKCVHDMYLTCEVMPNLEILTEFREDGKKGSECYSSPRFFFDLWRSQQERNLSIRGDKRKRKKYRPYKRIQPPVPTPCSSHPAMMQRRGLLKLKGEGKELAEINCDRIKRAMASKNEINRDDNDNISNGDPAEVYSEVSLAPRDRSATIGGGLLSALKKQGVVEHEPPVHDETDVVADLLQRQMDLSDSEDLGWDDDEFDDDLDE